MTGATVQDRTDHRETADDYRGELFRLGNHRVAVCADGMQWLLQSRRFEIRAGGTAWDTRGFCATRKALLRLTRSLCPDLVPFVATLPEHFKRKGGAA